MSDNTSLIMAAINTVGPKNQIDPSKGTYEQQVSRAAEDIIIMSNPQGRIAQGLEEFKTIKPFTAVVSAVGVENTSTRGFIGLASKADGKNDGVDTIRTNRTDSDPSAMMMVNELANLLGHRILVYKRMETTKDGTTKVRILHRFEDLGKAPKQMIDEILPSLKAAKARVEEKAELVAPSR